MTHNTSLTAVFFLVLFGLGQVFASAQQAGTSRLLVSGSSFQQMPSPFNGLLYEVDPGSAQGSLLPNPSANGSNIGSPDTRAYDPIGGRIFFYNGGANPVLLTIDAATGNLLNSVTLPFEPSEMQYESSTGRLLALTCQNCLAGTPNVLPTLSITITLVEVNPQTGAMTNIGQVPNTFGILPADGDAAIDPVNHRYFFVHNSPLAFPAHSLAVIDTLSGTVLSDSTWPCLFCPDMYRMIQFDTSTGQLYGFSGLGVGGGSGLVTIDPATAAPTPVGPGHPLIIVGFVPVFFPSALDAARREYYTIGKYVTDPFGSISLHLFTFNLDTGELLGDPLIPMYYTGLLVDTVNVPLRGRATPSPSMCLVPGTTRTVTFESLLHSGEYYLPFVSCTPGSYAVPSSNLVVPLGFDFCTNLYLSQAAPTFFNLTSGNGVVGVLSPGGLASGSISLPATTPPGLNFNLSITFLTINGSLQWSGLHGTTIFHIRS